MRFIWVVGPWVAGSSGGMAGLRMAEKRVFIYLRNLGEGVWGDTLVRVEMSLGLYYIDSKCLSLSFYLVNGGLHY